MHAGETGLAQREDRQFEDFGVGRNARCAIELRTHLQRLAHGQWMLRPRVQHAAGVAQPRSARPVEDVRVDAGDLRRRIRAQPQHAAARLVDQLEGAQVEVAAGAGQQRIDVLDQRRNHQLVTVARIEVEQSPPELLDAARFAGKDVRNVFGE